MPEFNSIREYHNSCSSTQEFYDNVNKEIFKIIRENPNFVYPDNHYDICKYDSGPNSNKSKTIGCLFGRAFRNLGINVTNISGGIAGVLQVNGIKCPIKWYILQAAQDSGVFYGKLMSMFDRCDLAFNGCADNMFLESSEGE